MSDLVPLMSDNPDELEALLLRSADDDEPGDGALEKVSGALGVGAVALGAASTSAALASHTSIAGNPGAIAKPLGVLSLGKWLLAGLSAGFVASGGAHYVLPPAARPVAASVVVRAPTASRTPAGTEAAPVAPPKVEASVAADDARPAAQAAPRVTPSPTPAPAAAASAATGLVKPGPSSAAFPPLEATLAPAASSSPAVDPPSTLGDETRALDRVREDIAAGRPSQALAELERYRESWPRAELAAEASLLRVEAELRAGHRTEAEREAETLITRAPQSRYAMRARALLGVATPVREP